MREKKSKKKGGDRRCLGGDGRKAYQRDFGERAGEGVSWSREKNYRRQVVGSKEKESLPIFGGSEEHLQVWILSRFLIHSFSFSLFFIISSCYLSIVCCGLGFVESEFVSYLLCFIPFLVFFYLYGLFSLSLTLD